MGRCQLVVPFGTKVYLGSLPDNTRAVNFVDNVITETTIMILEGPRLPEWKPDVDLYPVMFVSMKSLNKYLSELPLLVDDDDTELESEKVAS